MKIISLLSTILVLALIGFDINERFLNVKDASKNEPQLSGFAGNLSLPQLDKEQQLRIRQAFMEYDQKADKAVSKLPGLSLEQQLQQQGELTQLFVGDKLYRLMAIVSPEEQGQELLPKFALLQVTNIKDNQVEVIKIVHGGELSDYKVKITDTKKVNFRHKQRKLELLMYQPNQN
ncbi:hypothetical protein SG34_021630 [Thalassomonas viridans]|uniref:Uncharacterized protein n=1 Tax=Thalassomonas viridans TaxID=137584 RepID=A0AAE9Z2D7_9GAMM|nr:hypothetical protein [Thalassomonas viridans]WDE03947.1 hypothetical protein SG34_021630 [Thalassomonas viridans]